LGGRDWLRQYTESTSRVVRYVPDGCEDRIRGFLIGIGGWMNENLEWGDVWDVGREAAWWIMWDEEVPLDREEEFRFGRPWKTGLGSLLIDK
jgi:hypothetical protein